MQYTQGRPRSSLEDVPLQYQQELAIKDHIYMFLTGHKLGKQEAVLQLHIHRSIHELQSIKGVTI